MGERDTIALLAAWGEWTRIGCNNLRAGSSMLAVMAQGAKSNNFVDPDITDTDALRVDRVVAQLGLRNKLWAEVINLYFVQARSMREIELRLKISKFTAAKEFAGACGWVDCALQPIQKEAA